MAAHPRVHVLALTLCGLFLVAGCGSDDDGKGDPAGTDPDGSTGGDAGTIVDALAEDGTTEADAGASDGAPAATDGGAGDAGSNDTGGTQDAGQPEVDAGPTTVDAVVEKCGDGVCEAPDETLITCAVDCAGGANCGDGKCDGLQENAFTCKKDCEVTASKTVGCIMGGCTSDVVVCLKDADCGKALGCVQGCGSDMACLTNCGANTSSDTQQKLGAVVLCGVQQGCFGVGGDGGKCGNGKCEGPTENPVTCVKDCPAPVCGDGKCDPPLESYLVCAKDCSKPVCGDGTCDQPFESVLTCANDCKPSTCGDGTCDKPDETSLNCFEDCKPGNAQSNCIAQKCVKEGLACSGDLKCLQASLCTANCSDKTCFDACGKDLPAGSAKLFKAIEDCGTTNSCF